MLAVLGSVTPPGRLHAALLSALASSPAGVDHRLVDLADLPVGFVGATRPETDRTDLAVDAIAAADAVLFATPVYRGSMSGALKNLFDAIPVAALERKPVGLLAMGASDHHFLGADRHLRDVLTFFGALVAPVSVYLTSADFEAGVPRPEALSGLRGLISELAELAVAVDGTGASGPRPLAARTAAAG